MSHDQFDLRKAEPADFDEIVSVCSASLGWTNTDFDSELFRWKHFDNEFGESLLLVATDDSGIAAVRPFMKWRFRSPAGETIEAARAVDTATHPRAQGKGLFTRLTRFGLDELADDDTRFVFNTPNDKSLPGYLKMGWIEDGPIPFGYGASSPLALQRIVRSRTKADKPSLPIDIGMTVDEGLELLDGNEPCPPQGAVETDHGIDSLRWRFHSSPVEYRFLPGPDASGIICRLRQRGSARELVVAQRCGQLDNDQAGRAIRNAMKNTKADYCVGWPGLGSTVTNTRFGPNLALREVSGQFTFADQLTWQPGDIELF